MNTLPAPCRPLHLQPQILLGLLFDRLCPWYGRWNAKRIRRTDWSRLQRKYESEERQRRRSSFGLVLSDGRRPATQGYVAAFGWAVYYELVRRPDGSFVRDGNRLAKRWRVGRVARFRRLASDV